MLKNKLLIEKLIKSIAKNTGLLIRPQDWETLRSKLLQRMDALKISSLEEYYQLLEKDSPQKQLKSSGDLNWFMDRHRYRDMKEREWEQLVQLLTTGESYFFRDSGQFWLLRNRILPELIAYQRQVCQTQGKEKPTLRIWSAGCSTGEEPYSLAIVLTELIPDWQSWHLCILGTDINTDSIEKAKQGLYGTWSFRTVDEQKKTTYFILDKNRWRIKDSIKQLVTFESGNLLKDNCPDSRLDMVNVDLILCRNVFVYFEPKAIAQVLEKFDRLLRPGGYLLTGHAELYDQKLGHLFPKIFPQSVIYERTNLSRRVKTNIAENYATNDNKYGDISIYLASTGLENNYQQQSENPNVKNNWLIKGDPIATPSESPNSQDSLGFNKVLPMSDPLNSDFVASDSSVSSGKDLSLPESLQELNRLFEERHYPEVIKQAKKIISLQPKNYEVYYLLAKSLANLGNYAESEIYCNRAIQINYQWIQPYYILAEIYEDKGELESAKSILKKIIYLCPSSIKAYLQIAEIYEREGDLVRVKKMRLNAMTLLKKIPESTLLDGEEEKIQAGDLLNHLRKVLHDE